MSTPPAECSRILQVRAAQFQAPARGDDAGRWQAGQASRRRPLHAGLTNVASVFGGKRYILCFEALWRRPEKCEAVFEAREQCPHCPPRQIGSPGDLANREARPGFHSQILAHSVHGHPHSWHKATRYEMRRGHARPAARAGHAGKALRAGAVKEAFRRGLLARQPRPATTPRHRTAGNASCCG